MKNLTELLEVRRCQNYRRFGKPFCKCSSKRGNNYICFLRSRRNCICCYKSFTKVEFKQTQLNNIQEA